VAWNTEETQARLKAAAVQEFAAHGLAGTRVERIAERAGVNKERLYKYFGSKEDLYATVLSEELARIAAAVPVLGPPPDDIGEYAGRCFDYHCDHPELVRLLHWESLELAPDHQAPDEAARTKEYREKVAALKAAQANGQLVDDVEPHDLLFMIIAMAAWWVVAPRLARMITGKADTARGELRRRRASVVAAAGHLAAPNA